MMTIRPTITRAPARGLSTIIVAAALVGAWGAPLLRGGQSGQAAQPRALPADPWQVGDLMEPAALAKSLSGAADERPLVLCVGFPVLYRGGHVVGSKLAGPASKPDGILALKHAVQNLPRDQPIVLYCGCCPWKDCPNIRPAFRTMQELGFRHVRFLLLPENFQHDWIAKGFPIQKGGDAD